MRLIISSTSVEVKHGDHDHGNWARKPDVDGEALAPPGLGRRDKRRERVDGFEKG